MKGDAMDEERLSGRLRSIVIRALNEATRRGAGTVEAEHLLLAIAADDRSDTAAILAEAGLDYAAIDAALTNERAHSLTLAGVTPVDATQLTSTPRRTRPAWGASLREAMGRAHRHSTRQHRNRSRMAESDLVVGIVQAKLGTVPRALALAGIDQDALIARLQHASAL